MWSLESLKSVSQLHRIFVGEDYVVGRKDAKLLIVNDPSVSRKHAILCVKHPEQNLAEPSNRSTLFVKDEGSKYGSFKNNMRIRNGEEIDLDVGDIVKFGQFQSEYRVKFSPLVVTTSCLDNSAKRNLRKSIHELGGHLIHEWRPSCTHLAMSSVKITVKALCCLVSAKPIVLPNFFMEYVESCRNVSSSSIREEKNYIPPTGEALIENASFDVNVKRKHIFQNKTFLFIDEKQFKKLHLGITMGGGNAVILSEDQLDASLVLKEGVCVIQPLKEFVASQEKMSFVKSVSSMLHSKKRRMIPEPDVGFAVAYCSTEKFCNPEFNVGAALLGSQKLFSQTFSLQEVYVPDTEQNSENAQRKNNFRSLSIDEALKPKMTSKSDLSIKDSINLVKESQDATINSKRKHSNDMLDAEPGPSTSTKELKSKRSRKDSYSKLSFADLEAEFEDPPQRHPSSPIGVKEEIDSSFEIGPHGAASQAAPETFPETLPMAIRTETIKDDQAEHTPIVNGVQETIQQHGLAPSFIDKKPLIPRPFVDDDTSRNLMKIEFASLVRSTPKPATVVRNEEQGTVKNFKKFKKVLPVGARALPKIIGAHELVAYDKHSRTNGEADEWDVDDPFNENNFEGSQFSEEEKGEFDWESQQR